MGFVFKNKSSHNKGLIVQGMPPHIRAVYSYSRVNIPGRDSSLTIFDGLNNINKSVSAHYEGDNIDDIKEWLSGSGDLILDNEPDRIYKAQILDRVEYKELIKNLLYKFTVVFNCRPYAYLFTGNNKISLTAAATLTNTKANYISRPYIKITGTGNVTLTINNRNTVFKGLTDFIEIDSELMNAYRTVDGAKVNANNLMYSQFPYLDPVENSVSWTGTVTKVEIIPRWCII